MRQASTVQLLSRANAVAGDAGEERHPGDGFAAMGSVDIGEQGQHRAAPTFGSGQSSSIILAGICLVTPFPSALVKRVERSPRYSVVDRKASVEEIAAKADVLDAG